MKILLKILKWFIIVILFLAIIAFITIKVASKDKPEVVEGKSGDQLAQQIELALNKPAWDSLDYLQWKFRSGTKYLWDKQGNNAQIEWGDHRVLMNLDKVDGKAFTNGVEQKGESKLELISKAWSFWCNDSFWMFAPFKLFDPGTRRDIVKLEDNSEGLMITYAGGGVTPGDVYVWSLDESNVPTGYQMWVKIIPLKGMEVSWENWKTLDNGAKVALTHNSKILSFSMEDVKDGTSLASFGVPEDLFSGI